MRVIGTIVRVTFQMPETTSSSDSCSAQRQRRWRARGTIAAWIRPASAAPSGSHGMSASAPIATASVITTSIRAPSSASEVHIFRAASGSGFAGSGRTSVLTVRGACTARRGS
jgi:hypothetical protein